MRKRKPKTPLTHRRKAEARARGGASFVGKPLTVNIAAQARYEAALHRQIDVMAAEVQKAVRLVFEANAPHLLPGSAAMDASISAQARILMNAMAGKFRVAWAQIAPGLAAKMTNDVDRATKAGLHASLKEASGGLSLKTSVVNGTTAQVMQSSIAANVALIKSIPDQYFTAIQGEVFRSIQSGHGTSDVLAHIEKTATVTKRRASLIARDQTSKATTALNKARLIALGVKKFRWLHSAGGNEPRPLHIDVLNRRTFSFDDPPIIDEHTGERGLPGQLINCRCRMIPVIDFGASDDDRAND